MVGARAGGAPFQRDSALLEFILAMKTLWMPYPSPQGSVGLSEQLAQKLHACTGPHSKGRARDILDILLMDLLGKLDYAKVRVAAEAVFVQRATHAFPPSTAIPPSWRAELQTLAKELGYPVTDPGEIELKFRTIVQTIEKASLSDPSEDSLKAEGV